MGPGSAPPPVTTWEISSSNPPGPRAATSGPADGASNNLEKPIVVAVQGAAIGGADTSTLLPIYVVDGGVVECKVPAAVRSIWRCCRFCRLHIERPAAANDRPSSGGEIVPAGRALRCRASGGAGRRYSRSA